MSAASLAHLQQQVPLYTQAFLTCPLCHAADIEYEFVASGTAYSRCRGCTLLFANPAPNERGVPASRVPSAPYNALRAFAGRYLGREPRSVLIVDGGDAPLDPEAAMCPVNAIDRAGTYDLVIAHGVVDRDPNPLASALTLRSLVAEGGALLITTPSIASPDAKSQRDRWAAFASKAAWYLTPDTAQLLLTRAGFGMFAPIVDAHDLDPGVDEETARFFRSHIAVIAAPRQFPQRRVLSVIVPVFNEAATVAELLDRVLAKTVKDAEIEVVIIESNSTDGSRDIVNRYSDHPRVKVVLEDVPQGKGHAVRTGLKHATGEVILFQDADLEYDVNDYDDLVEPLFALRRNFVLGSRHNANGDSWKIRRFGGKPVISLAMNVAHLGLLTMFNRLYDQSLFDPFTMYKVFRRDCLHGLEFECNRFDFDYEISIKLIRKGYHPIELPVNYRSRSYGDGKKVAFFRDPPTWIRAMLRQKRSPLYSFER